MNVACLLLLSFTMSDAPKPVPADGRIRFWADGVFVDMKQDGSDIKNIDLPNNLTLPISHTDVSNDFKSTVGVQFFKKKIGENNFGYGATCTIRPLFGDFKAFELKGYITRMIYSVADQKVLFFGIKGDSWQESEKDGAFWLYNITTKTAEKIKLPEGHFIIGNSRNLKYYLTRVPLQNNNATPINYFLVDAKTLKSKEVSLPFADVKYATISPNGESIIVQMTMNDFANPGTKREDIALYDVSNKKLTTLTPQLNPTTINTVAWSPDVRKIAYLDIVNLSENPNGRILGPGNQLREYNITVADGSNAKVIYKTTAGYFRTFQWIEK